MKTYVIMLNDMPMFVCTKDLDSAKKKKEYLDFEYWKKVKHIYRNDSHYKSMCRWWIEEVFSDL